MKEITLKPVIKITPYSAILCQDQNCEELGCAYISCEGWCDLFGVQLESSDWLKMDEDGVDGFMRCEPCVASEEKTHENLP